MLAPNLLALVAERPANPLQQNAEVIVVLDELQDVDNHLARAGIGHDARNLTHLVAPEFAQVLI